MSWFRRKAPPPDIPPYTPPVVVPREHAPTDEGILVEEAELKDVGIDVDAMTRTGIHKAWDRFASKLKGE